MIDLNKLAAEIHEAAVKKGFWEVEDAEERHVAKMHSELSEAIQEDRCGRPLLYVDDIEVMDRITDPAMFDGRKPEGVAAELADFVMMVLDWARERDVVIADTGKVFQKEPAFKIDEVTLPHLVNNMHEGVMLVMNDWVPKPDLQIAFMTYCVEHWLKARGIDLFDVIRQKMAYNESRPELHGRLY